MVIRVSGALLRFTDYRRSINVDAPTVEAALDVLSTQYEPLRKVIFDRSGQVRGTHRIFLNGEQLDSNQLASPVCETDSVDLLFAISGG